MRIKLNSSNFNATILGFSEKFYYLFWHIFIFGNMFPASHGFVALQVINICIREDTCSNFPILKMNEDEIVRTCDRQSNETATLKERVTKYENMRNGWSNLAEYLKVVALKLLELT